MAYEILAAPGLNDLDWQMPPVPLGSPDDTSVENLRIGYWTDDGFFPPSASVRRTVEQAAQALREAARGSSRFRPLMFGGR